ncbi:MAG: UDP-N-acetylenolpyruvoylglucosamine reductase [Deltaproteobacteria bacterium]|nr:UDP-N-acetylmuramate dehydrogenase [Deltaproteobacteria bacterium]MBW2717780.1 UDP-N-acetylmuramate dehydrogenase [Deltaproteobacteria bacterium]RLB52124.1 MAG: UDP-N-acetylenolpyruvoylglucosamine reductase [Deltaproteobacteria bacterium]
MSTLGIQRDVPLAPLTTLELGGPAKYFVRVDDESALADVLRWAADEGMPSAILGGGSNLIVPDEGYDGLVVHMGIGNLDFRGDGTVDAGAGVPWETVVDGALSRDWAGLECLTGIPGSVGAAPIQNVGAYGQEVAEVVAKVRVLRRETLALEELVPEDCAFGYRDSLFKREPGRFIVCGVRFALRPHGPATVRYAELHGAIGADATLADVRGAVLELRRRKSMLIDPHDPNHRSAGSFFLNPIVSGAEAERVVGQAVRDNVVAAPSDVPRYPAADGEVKLAAGWLIEKAGIAKGTRRGAIGVSTKHALTLVHHGGGTTADLLAFADEIRARVRDRFGVDLQREPRLLA